MKKTTLILLFLLINIVSYCQVFEKIKKLAPYNMYISGITASPDHKYYALSSGSYMTRILDTNFNMVKEFTYEGAWGGGSPEFSFDNKLFALRLFGPSDTLIIYDLKKKTSVSFPYDVYGYKFFHTRNELLLSSKGKFSVYKNPGDEKNIIKNAFSVGSGAVGFVSEFVITKDDSFVYATTPQNELCKFSTSTWEKVATVAQYNEEISEVTLSGSGRFLMYNVDKTVYVYDLKQAVISEKFKVPFVIAVLAMDEKHETVFVGGREEEQGARVFQYSIRDKKVTPLFKELKSYGVYGIYVDELRNLILIGNDSQLWVYKIK